MTAPGGRPVRLTEFTDPASALAALEDIFFESSSRTSFASTAERNGFRERWTSFYLNQCRADVWFWQDADGTVSGYLTGCRDSAGAGPLFRDLPAYAVFETCFGAFPAHLHVNCRADRRGQGIGAALVEVFVSECRAAGLPGIHLVTAPDARNVGFYQRLGFTIRELRPFGSRSLLFLGRSLITETHP